MPGERPIEMREMGWRVPASILIGVGWLAFVIIWLFFFATDFSFYKNLAILFVSVLLTLALLAITWIGFGLRMGELNEPEAMRWGGFAEIRWRAVLSVLIIAAWSIFFLVWLFVYADSFSGYQNIAVIIASLLVAGGLISLPWIGVWRHAPPH